MVVGFVSRQLVAELHLRVGAWNDLPKLSPPVFTNLRNGCIDGEGVVASTASSPEHTQVDLSIFCCYGLWRPILFLCIV